MGKHTPGPWLGRGKSDSVHRPCDTHPYGEQIFAFHPDYAPNDADHALILAAPTLRGHLEAVISVAESEVQIMESDRGKGRSVEELYATGEMPEELVAARAFLAQLDGERP